MKRKDVMPEYKIIGAYKTGIEIRIIGSYHSPDELEGAFFKFYPPQSCIN